MEQTLPNLNGKIKDIITTVDDGNVSRFAKRLKGVSQQRLNRIFNPDPRTKKYPTVPDDVLIAIAKSMPDVNLDWLLADKGNMLKVEQHIENSPNSLAIGRDANGSEIHITSQKVDEFIRVMEKHQEHTDKMLTIIEKLINK
jgi:hypothetical protein